MKRITIFFLGLGATLLLTGCVFKPQMSVDYGPEKMFKREKVVGRLILVEGMEAWRSPSDGYNKATRNIHVLQNAADATLNEGYTHFAFISPQGLAQGSMINTAEEFIEQCAPSGVLIFTIGNDKCGFPKGDYYIVPAAIYAFKGQPKSYLTFDAKAVREYLIQKGHYREDTYTKVEFLRYKSTELLSPKLSVVTDY